MNEYTAPAGRARDALTELVLRQLSENNCVWARQMVAFAIECGIIAALASPEYAYGTLLEGGVPGTALAATIADMREWMDAHPVTVTAQP